MIAKAQHNVLFALHWIRFLSDRNRRMIRGGLQAKGRKSGQQFLLVSVLQSLQQAVIVRLLLSHAQTLHGAAQIPLDLIILQRL